MAMVLFLEILHLSQPSNLSWFWSQNKEVFSARNLMFCHVNTQMVLLPYHFFLFRNLSSRKSGTSHQSLNSFLELLPEALHQLWQKTFSFLCSKVNRSGNLKSLSIKDSAQIRVVREHLPNINLTYTREPQHWRFCSLTRVRKFFQINSVQRSLRLANVSLKSGRTCIDTYHGILDCSDFHLQPFSRFPSLLDLARTFLSLKHMFSCTNVRNKLLSISKISADVFSLCFKMSLHSQFLNFLIEEVKIG